jgi:hypothetical protein
LKNLFWASAVSVTKIERGIQKSQAPDKKSTSAGGEA